MSRSRTIARVHEIDIRLHPTFALVFVWVLLDWRRLSNGQGALAVLFTLILVLLVFGCVLLHEFGHAFMAREHGVRVHDVSLSAVGGVARMDQLPADPRSEVLIALAGPAVNLAFSVALMPIALLVGVLSGFSSLHDYALTVFAPSLPGLITTLLYANLLLVAFNILPAFPMDGGRVFRAGMTAIIGREAGTRVAVVVGQLFAAVLLLVSIFVVQSAIMALLAVFIFVVAYAEGRAVRVESALRRMRVGQFALWDMGGIAPSQPIANALRGGPRDVAVTEDGRVIGMLWRNRLLAQLGTSQAGIVVGDVMDRDVLSVDVDDTVYDVHQLMTERQRWAVPVTESGTYRGIFTNDRLLHIYRQLAPDPIRVLRNFISQSPFERLRT